MKLFYLLFLQRIEGGSLVIINASFTNAGEYECMVKSAVGKISSRSAVIVEGPPGVPGIPTQPIPRIALHQKLTFQAGFM